MNKKKLIVIVFSFLIIPSFVFAQHYIIEDIPNTGDDGLRPEIVKVISAGSKTVKEKESDIITETKTIRGTITEIINSNKNKVMLAGVVSGAVLAMASTAIPFFATTPTMAQDIIFLNMFGFLVKRKNKNRWGVVFDIKTKTPIPAAKITLFDESMKELETTYSDREGRFGFLAEEGVYVLGVEKKNYEAFIESPNDDLYGELYTGGKIVVGENDVLSISVALKSININWDEYASKKSIQYSGTWSLVKKYLFTTLYGIGFIVTTLITFFYPSVFNIIILGINIILFVIIFFVKKKGYGTVESVDKDPIPFAVVNLYDENNSKKAFAVTDVIGRYYMLADNGSYNMKVVGQPIGGNKKEVSGKIHVSEEIVNKDVILK